MIFVATLTHTPELCFGNKEYQDEGKKWFQEMGSRAKELSIKILGAYVSPNEHVFYIILESDDFGAVSEFLGPPMLTHHSAQVSPVITLEKAFGLSFIE